MLSAFLDQDVFRLWTLVVTDHEAGDDGRINRFGIEAAIDAVPKAEVPEPASLALFGAALIGLAGLPRKARARAH